MKQVASNKKAFHDYEIIEKFEAGISLLGSEAKSIRNNDVSLGQSFISVIKSEVYIKNMNISKYKMATIENHDPKRMRKLLLRKSEIRKLEDKVKQQGLTIIPLSLGITSRGLIKLNIALAKGKTKGDKREKAKEKQFLKLKKEYM